MLCSDAVSEPPERASTQPPVAASAATATNAIAVDAVFFLGAFVGGALSGGVGGSGRLCSGALGVVVMVETFLMGGVSDSSGVSGGIPERHSHALSAKAREGMREAAGCAEETFQRGEGSGPAQTSAQQLHRGSCWWVILSWLQLIARTIT